MRKIAAALALTMSLMVALAGCGNGGSAGTNSALGTKVEGTYFTASMPGKPETRNQDMSQSGMSMKLAMYMFGEDTEAWTERYAIIEADYKDMMEQVAASAGGADIKSTITQAMVAQFSSQGMEAEKTQLAGQTGLKIDFKQAMAASGAEQGDMENAKGDAALIMTDQAMFIVMYMGNGDKYSEANSKAFFDSFATKDTTNDVLGLE